MPHLLVACLGYTLFVDAALPGVLTARLSIGLPAFGLLTSAPLGAFVLGQWPAARLADRYPTTLVLLWTTVAHAVLAAGTDLALAAGFPTYLAVRTLWGGTAGMLLSVGATQVARLELGAAGTRSQGVYGGLLTLGGAVGFLLAGATVAATGGPGLHAVGGLAALAAVFERFPILEQRQRQRTRTMSRGQQQMLAMGSALMLDPDLLLLDEPSAGLAPELVEDMFEKIDEINDAGTAVLMVEQNATEALRRCDRGYVLVNGENAYEGPGRELLADPEVRERFLGG